MARAGAALALVALFSMLLAAQFIASPLGLGLLRPAPIVLASPSIGGLEVRLVVELAGPPLGLDGALLRSVLNQSARAYIYRLGGLSAPLPFELTPTRPIRLNLSAGAYGLGVEAGNFSLVIARFSVQPGKLTEIEVRVDAYLPEFIPIDVEDLNGDGCLGPGEKAVGGLGLGLLGGPSPPMGWNTLLIWPPSNSARALLRPEAPPLRVLVPSQANGTALSLALAYAPVSVLPQACVPDGVLLGLPLYVLLFTPSYVLREPEG
jgi:hypothetical protein